MDHQMIEKVFKEKRDSFVKRISRRVPNVADAEDIVQDAFVRAISYAHTFDPSKGDVDQWFNTILNNVTRAWQRNNRLQGMTVEINEENGGMFYTNEEGKDLSRCVLEEISKCKGLKKEVLYRWFVMNMTYKDIQEILDVKKPRVAKILDRFRTEMRDKYGEVV